MMRLSGIGTKGVAAMGSALLVALAAACAGRSMAGSGDLEAVVDRAMADRVRVSANLRPHGRLRTSPGQAVR